MSKLYLIPTPIGNLEDITLRAIRILKKVDLILAEDTRDSKKLLQHFEIAKPMQSYHQFNEHKVLPGLIEKLKAGTSMALITDAGTPGISDPGFLIVRECIANAIKVETLPGAAAFVPALVNSGLPCDKFLFEGFLPLKKGRKTKLEQLAGQPYTMVFYESPYRLLKTLEQMKLHFGNRKAAISRELSKIHEENVRGTLETLIEHFKASGVKGEIVITVEGKNYK